MQKVATRTGSEVEEEFERAILEGRGDYIKGCGFQDKVCNDKCSLWDKQNGCCVFTVIAKKLDLK